MPGDWEERTWGFAVFCLGVMSGVAVLIDLSRSMEGETARRAAREWIVISRRNCQHETKRSKLPWIRERTSLLDLCCFRHGCYCMRRILICLQWGRRIPILLLPAKRRKIFKPKAARRTVASPPRFHTPTPKNASHSSAARQILRHDCSLPPCRRNVPVPDLSVCSASHQRVCAGPKGEQRSPPPLSLV